MTFIYGLIDPRTNELRYVGKSVRPIERLATHIREARSGSILHSRRWIDGLTAVNLRPELLILEEVDGDANECERFWIASMKLAGCSLTNRTIGGDGQAPGYVPSVEAKAKISAKLSGRKRTPEQLVNLRAAFNSPEVRALRRINARPENFGAGRLGIRDSELTKRRKAASWTVERKAKQAERLRAKSFDDRWRAQLADALKVRWDKYRASH